MRTKFSKTISTGVAPWRRKGRINKEEIILLTLAIIMKKQLVISYKLLRG